MRPAALCLLLAAGLPAAPSQMTFFPAQQSQSLDNAGAGARAMALGSAFVAVADDSTALSWNPAGLAGRDSDVVGLHHNAWLGGISQDNLGLALRTDGWGGVGLALDNEDFGSFDQRDAGGNITGSFGASRLGLGLGWGGGLGNGLDLGVALRASRETLAGTAINSVAASGGFLLHPAPGLRVGGSYNDAGNAAGDGLASGLFLGAAQQFRGRDFQTLLLGGVEIEAAGVNRVQLGLESGYQNLAAFRIGYLCNFQQDAWQGLSGLTLGGGVGLGPVKLDYAWLPFGDLGASQRVSLEYSFGAAALGPACLPLPAAASMSNNTPALPRPVTGTPSAAVAATPTTRVDTAFNVLSDGYLLGQQLERNRQDPQAADAYRLAVQDDPSDLLSWEALARLLVRQGMLDAAGTCYANVLRLNKDDEEAAGWLRTHGAGGR